MPALPVTKSEAARSEVLKPRLIKILNSGAVSLLAATTAIGTTRATAYQWRDGDKPIRHAFQDNVEQFCNKMEAYMAEYGTMSISTKQAVAIMHEETPGLGAARIECTGDK
ncbi:MAG: hypothetical protein ACYCSH_16420 [Acidithiobacillus sp.]